MANKKFSEFTLKTDSANVDFVVGYDGSDNVRIAPSNLSSGGATSLNGLTDCLVDTDSLYVGEVPSGLSGNPQDNTILGIKAGDSLTSGDSNTLIGNNAGDSITTGTNSVAVGMDALAGTSTVGNNVAVGKNAYKAGTSSNNVYVGYDAGSAATTGSYQVGIGVSAGNSDTGSGSISIGWFANRNNTADRTIGIGYQAGYSQTSGSSNTYVGERAGYSNTTSANNTYIGDQTGYSASGANNTSIGKSAFGGGFGHTGTDNVAIGYQADQQPSGASNYNVAIGSQALKASGTRTNNVAVGYKAGTAITTSPDNTFIGYQSGLVFDNTSGDGRNVGVGSTSGAALTTGIYNTFLGYGAGNGGGGTSATVTTGNFNTMVGYQAKGSATSASNQNSFGYSAACSGDNQVTLGNSSIATIRAQVTNITAISDERDKTDIEIIPYGLDFVNSLQPKKFVWDNRAETDGDGNEFFSANKGKKDIGFIAQELQTVDDDYLNLVYDANPEKLEATYGRLIPVLVKAIQDLSAKVTALENA